jgi:hypothetical protein
MPYECEFCKNSYSTKSTLKTHQKTTIKCLDIQKNLGLELEIKYFICEFCDKNLTSKKNLENHLSTCFKKIEHKDIRNKLYYENKIKELENMYENKIKQLENTSENKIKEIKELENKYESKIKEIKELENKYENKIKEILVLETKLEIYSSDHDTITEIAKLPRNIIENSNNNNNNHNKVLNIKTSIDFDDKTQIENALSNYNLEYFLDGQKGVARFVFDNILKDEDNNLKYLCTDTSRSIFKYKDKLGNIQKDHEAKKLTSYLVEGGIKDKVIDISEKWINTDTKVDKNKLEIVLEKNNEVNDIDKNNQVFKKELASIVAL